MFKKIMKMEVKRSTVACLAALFGLLFGYGPALALLYWIITDIIAMCRHSDTITAGWIFLVLIKACFIWVCLVIKTVFIKAANKLLQDPF